MKFSRDRVLQAFACSLSLAMPMAIPSLAWSQEPQPSAAIEAEVFNVAPDTSLLQDTIVSRGGGMLLTINREEPTQANPMLGIRLQPLNETLKTQLGISTGVVVETVVGKNSEVIKPHDILLAVGGKEVTDSQTLAVQLHDVKPGDVEVKLLRVGKPLTVIAQNHQITPDELAQLNPASQYGFTQLSRAALAGNAELPLGLTHNFNRTVTQPISPEAVSKYVIGVELDHEPISETVKGVLGIQQGVIVKGAREGSPAQKAGIAKWDIITQINKQPVGDYETLRKAVDSSEGKELELTIMRNKSGEVTFKITPELRPQPESTAALLGDKLSYADTIFTFGNAMALRGGTLGGDTIGLIPTNGSLEVAKDASNKILVTVQTHDKEGKSVVQTFDLTPEGIASLPEELRPLGQSLIQPAPAVTTTYVPATIAPRQPPVDQQRILGRPAPNVTSQRQIVIATPDGRTVTVPAPAVAVAPAVAQTQQLEQVVAELKVRSAESEKQLQEIQAMLKTLIEKSAEKK